MQSYLVKANKRRVATPQEAQTAAKEQAQVIELSVAGEEAVSFWLVRIPAADVATRTVVFEDNAREQSFLNEHALSDVLTTLKNVVSNIQQLVARIKTARLKFLMLQPSSYVMYFSGQRVPNLRSGKNINGEEKILSFYQTLQTLMKATFSLREGVKRYRKRRNGQRRSWRPKSISENVPVQWSFG